ncbi:hypothetical protein E8E11_008919 [Didymella keratinophila]|nr:hypothetical protein E8E11_008919 [Didymella keratinophila]
MSFIRKMTIIPVLEVIVFDANLDNELGYEWILLKHGRCKSFAERWHDLSWLKREVLVRKIADYVTQLSQIEPSDIGSLYQSSLGSTDPENVHHVVGEYVDPYFFTYEHIQVKTHRGPYTCSSEWLAAHLEIMLYDIANLRAGDVNDHELSVAMQRMFDKIQTIMCRVFPDVDPEPTFLYIHNIDDYNIMIDDEGDLVCILNWSGLNVVPAWAACQLPCFLNVIYAKYTREPASGLCRAV